MVLFMSNSLNIKRFYKKPETNEVKDDPLERLARQAEQAGIEVIKN